MGDSEDKWSDPRPWFKEPEQYEEDIKKLKKFNKELTSMFYAVLIELDKEGKLEEIFDKVNQYDDIHIRWFWTQYKNGYFDLDLIARLQSKTYLKKKKPDQS